MRRVQAIASLLAALTAPTVLSAAEFRGFYVGAGAGYESHHPESDRSDLGTNVFHADGAAGRLYAGGGALMDRFYLGAEIDVGAGTASPSNKSFLTDGIFTQDVTTEVEQSFYYGLDLIGGYLVADRFMIYGKVGVEQGEYDYKVRVAPVPGVGGGGTAKGDTTLTGVRFGAGVGMHVTDNIAARLEYRGMIGVDDIKVTHRSGTETITDKVTPERHEVMLSVQYNF